MVTAVATIGLGAIGLVALQSSVPAYGHVEVTYENGRIEILLTDLEAQPDEVERALRAQGLDVSVEPVPTGPSNRGRFTGIGATDPGIVDVHDDANPGRPFLGFSLPEGWKRTLHIGLGRAAAPGEGYGAFTDAFAQGEPLACRDLDGQPLRAAFAELRDRHLSVKLQPIADGAYLDIVPIEAAMTGGYRDWYIAAGTAMSANDVVIDIVPHPPTSAPIDPC